jgi:hypothetical protein
MLKRVCLQSWDASLEINAAPPVFNGRGRGDSGAHSRGRVSMLRVCGDFAKVRAIGFAADEFDGLRAVLDAAPPEPAPTPPDPDLATHQWPQRRGSQRPASTCAFTGAL